MIFRLKSAMVAGAGHLFASSAMIIISLVGALTESCGQETFTDGAGSPPKPNSAESTKLEAPASTSDSGLKAVNWLWTCDTQSGKDGEKSGNVVLRNAGRYDLKADKNARIPVKFSGSVCTPQQAPRDIVIVIDVSGSMNANDPVIGNSCGRLNAVNSLLASIPKGSDVRYGIVTFSTGVVAHSSKFFADATGLFQDAMASAGVSTVVDVLCDAAGDTNYDSALTSAQGLFAAARSTASKEIFFVSDGEPSGKNDGKVAAAALRNSGVTIGTIMLDGNDQVLQQSIASKDQNGQPLHSKVTDANQLAQAFAKVSKNDLVGAELRWRVVGAPQFTVVNLLGQSSNLKFDLAPISITVDEASRGMEVEYEYWDSRGKHYKSQGFISWVEN